MLEVRMVTIHSDHCSVFAPKKSTVTLLKPWSKGSATKTKNTVATFVATFFLSVSNKAKTTDWKINGFSPF